MTTLRDAERVLGEIAPLELAQAWDNVGLIAGDPTAAVRAALLCIDLTGKVLEEAVGGKADLIVAYHPPIFRAVPSLRIDSDDAGPGPSLVARAIRAGIAVYSPHTALDAAAGGTGDAIARLCGAEVTGPLDFATEVGPTSSPGETAKPGPLAAEVKLTVFVPADHANAVGEAMFAAGAGRIGLYERCSFRIPGTGTFFAGAGTDPAVGQRGRLETVDEIRLETVCPRNALPEVVAAMRAAHPYEEPAFDLFALAPKPRSVGIGRLARLPKPEALGRLAARLGRAAGASCVQIVGDARRPVQRLAILVGSAGRVQEQNPRARGADVLITGEIRHHDALAIRGKGGAAIALGHWASERPVLKALAEALRARLGGVSVRISRADHDPFAPASKNR